MIPEHLLLLLFTTLTIIGWHQVTRPGYLLQWFGKRFLYIEEEQQLQNLPQFQTAQQIELLDMIVEGAEELLNSEESQARVKRGELPDQAEMTLFLQNAIIAADQKTSNKVKARGEQLHKIILQKRSEWWWRLGFNKPLGECPTCASSLFGTITMLWWYFGDICGALEISRYAVADFGWYASGLILWAQWSNILLVWCVSMLAIAGMVQVYENAKN